MSPGSGTRASTRSRGFSARSPVPEPGLSPHNARASGAAVSPMRDAERGDAVELERAAGPSGLVPKRVPQARVPQLAVEIL